MFFPNNTSTLISPHKVNLRSLLFKTKGQLQTSPPLAFGKGDHISILLLSAYRQCLKVEEPVFRAVHKWSEDAISRLQDFFESTDWQFLHDAAGDNINKYTASVISYINKFTEDVVSTVNVMSIPKRNHGSVERCAPGCEHELQPSTLGT